MKVIEKGQKRKKSILLRAALLAFAVYVVVGLINQQVQISQKAQELESLTRQIQVAEVKNDELKHTLSSGDATSAEYMERVARETLDYAHPGERVFVNIAGK